MIYAFIGLGIVLLIALWFIAVMNRLNTTKVKIDEASSGIDVALTKRYDVLTKMMDTVRAYKEYEKETLTEVIKLRQGATVKEKNEFAAAMSDQIAKINVVAEAYPELRSSENFVNFQKAIADTEEHLQAARRFYNSNVSAYNQMLVTFPDSIVANIKGLTKEDFFEAEEMKKQDVKINL